MELGAHPTTELELALNVQKVQALQTLIGTRDRLLDAIEECKALGLKQAAAHAVEQVKAAA